VWRLRSKYITSTPGNTIIIGLRVISLYAIAVALVHANAALGASAMQACCSLACTHAPQADQADQQSPAGIMSHDCMHVPVWHRRCTCHDDNVTLVAGTSSPHEQYLFHVASRRWWRWWDPWRSPRPFGWCQDGRSVSRAPLTAVAPARHNRASPAAKISRFLLMPSTLFCINAALSWMLYPHPVLRSTHLLRPCLQLPVHVSSPLHPLRLP
jgi:hypothetical protein